MPVTHLSGRKARIEVSLDGITFTRSESEAARHEVPRRIHVNWDDVSGAEVQTTRKGRAVIRVSVTGVPAAPHQRDDPHAVKVPRKLEETAREIVAQINDEIAGRRRWKQHAQA